jgi:hypothetical protein
VCARARRKREPSAVRHGGTIEETVAERAEIRGQDYREAV